MKAAKKLMEKALINAANLRKKINLEVIGTALFRFKSLGNEKNQPSKIFCFLKIFPIKNNSVWL